MSTSAILVGLASGRLSYSLHHLHHHHHHLPTAGAGVGRKRWLALCPGGSLGSLKLGQRALQGDRHPWCGGWPVFLPLTKVTSKIHHQFCAGLFFPFCSQSGFFPPPFSLLFKKKYSEDTKQTLVRGQLSSLPEVVKWHACL